jgi:hypothetical protein
MIHTQIADQLIPLFHPNIYPYISFSCHLSVNFPTYIYPSKYSAIHESVFNSFVYSFKYKYKHFN